MSSIPGIHHQIAFPKDQEGGVGMVILPMLENMPSKFKTLALVSCTTHNATQHNIKQPNSKGEVLARSMCSMTLPHPMKLSLRNLTLAPPCTQKLLNRAIIERLILFQQIPPLSPKLVVIVVSVRITQGAHIGREEGIHHNSADLFLTHVIMEHVYRLVNTSVTQFKIIYKDTHDST